MDDRERSRPTRSDSRSRSPSASRSPSHHSRHHRHHHHHHHTSSRHHRSRRSPHRQRQTTTPTAAVSAPIVLPLNAVPISKHSLSALRPLFALYLDVQKQLYIDDLPEEEVRGRWKSFVGRWNRGELAEGWYDPSTRQKAVEAAATDTAARTEAPGKRRASPTYEAPRDQQPNSEAGNHSEGASSDDDIVGPPLPGHDDLRARRHGRDRNPGPAIPKLQDLELQRESQSEDRLTALTTLQHARRQDRLAQKAALDELLPRADPGTRERQLEKKRELNDKLRAFRDKSPAGAQDEVPDSELLGDEGGGEGGVEGFKKQKREWERKKNERELRKEEVLRARREEREERMMEHREKEDRTMGMLRALARQNFG